MQLTDQVYAQNTLNKHVVLSSDAKGSDFIEWHAAGDPNGNDLQIVPPDIAKTAAFQRLVNRGIVTLSDENSPEVIASFAAQRASWVSRTTKTSEAAQASIERTQQNDTLSMPCIGPDSRGTGQCGTQVPVKEKTKDERPVLCAQHIGLAPQYVSEQRQAPGSTVIETVWLRATVGAREVQHA